MALKKKSQKSEFERDGVKPSGIVWLHKAWEKLRLSYRTGQDTNPDAEPGDWGKGGD